MTLVVRAFTVGLVACLGALGWSTASPAQSKPTVQVNMRALDTLGPGPAADQDSAIVLKPPPGAKAVPTTQPEGTQSAAVPAERPATPRVGATKPAEKTAVPAVVPKVEATTTAGDLTPVPGRGNDFSIVFAEGSADLPASAKSGLAALMKKLAAEPATLLVISAYAKGAETDGESAQRLALSRALAVRLYMKKHGIEGARARIEAHGAEAESGPKDRVDLAIEK